MCTSSSSSSKVRTPTKKTQETEEGGAGVGETRIYIRVTIRSLSPISWMTFSQFPIDECTHVYMYVHPAVEYFPRIRRYIYIYKG